MKDFNYYAPTEVVFGEQSEEQVAALVRKYGGTKVAAATMPPPAVPSKCSRLRIWKPSISWQEDKYGSVFSSVNGIDAKCRKSAGKRVFQMELFPEAEA